MSQSINQVLLVGNLGRNPRLDKTKKDATPVCNFSIATSQSWVDAAGERQEKTDWHNCVLFGSRAKSAVEAMQKGDRVTVLGRLENNEFSSKDANGVEVRHKTSQVVVQKIIWDTFSSDDLAGLEE